LLVPLWVLAFAAARNAPCSTGRFLRAVVRESLLAGAVLIAVAVLMYLLCGGERAFLFLKFHSVRGVQIEAPVAWLVLVFDPSTEVGYQARSFTLRGPLSDRAARAMAVAMVAFAVLTTLISARGFWHAATRPEPVDRNQLATYLVVSSLLVWLGFILVNKVGSPQYMLWLAPLVPLAPLRRAWCWWIAIVLAAMVCTTLVFPYFYNEVGGEPTGDLLWSGPTRLGLALLAAKSVLVAAAFVWLTVIVWRNLPAPAQTSLNSKVMT